MLEVVRTPKKHARLVIAPSYKGGTFDSHAVDCPFPFFHDGKYWMTYVGGDIEKLTNNLFGRRTECTQSKN